VLACVTELAEQIKEKGRHSTSELPALLLRAEQLALDDSEDSLTRALAHRAAGNALRLLNRYEPALAHYNEAVALLAASHETAELARTLHASLVPLFFLGRFEELFASAGRAQTLFESLSDSRGIARLNVNLAHAYHRLERHHESLGCSEAAVEVLHKLGDVEGFVAASINSATTFTIMHEFERAEERYENARRAAEEYNLWSSVLLCRHNIAYLRYVAGDTDTALREYAALRMEYRKLDDEWQLCRCWLDEAEIFLEIGELQEAIHASRESCRLARKLSLNLEIGRALSFEAAAHLRLDNPRYASVLLQEAQQRFESEGNTYWTAASKLQAALLSEQNGTVALTQAMSVRDRLRHAGLPHRLAMAEIVIGRLQKSIGQMEPAIESFRSALQAAEQSRSLWMKFHASYELGASIAEQYPTEGTNLFKDAERLLDGLWNRLGSDELKMAFLADRETVYTHLVRFEAPSPQPAFEFSEKARSRVLKERLLGSEVSGASDAVQSRLHDDETILEYFLSGDDVYIFIVTPSAVRCVRREGVATRLKQTCLWLERHISSCSVKWEVLQNAKHHLLTTVREHLMTLRHELIDPVAEGLRKTVVVVPHSFLHGVPFHALLESSCVVYSPSALLYCTPPPELSLEGPLFIAFSRGSTSSALEIEESSAQHSGSTILINPELDALRQALAVPRTLVHIAGHAGIDTIGGRLSWIETPKGALTGRDLTDMHVRARTIVITGCQTARRVIRPGDEWQGLMRTFYISGASAIVSAFWDIRDDAARRFAREFYARFDGNNVPEAVQSASSVLKEWQPHPYFWAGFASFARRRP